MAEKVKLKDIADIYSGAILTRFTAKDSVNDIVPIVEGLQYAETMEMVVLKNGKIEFNVSFQDAYRIKIS